MQPVTGDQSSDQPDPVLRRLRIWADQQGHNQSAVARALGVSRAAVSSWFAGLEAGAQAANGRTFRYARQRYDVQARIAEVLGEPVESLRLRAAGLEPGAESQAFAEPDFRPTVAPDLWSAVREVLGAVAIRGMNAPGSSERSGDSVRHRVAAVAESVDDVVATLITADQRGHGVRRTLFHHMVTVFVRRPADEVDLAEYLTSRRERVAAALSRASLPHAWEPPWREPEVTFSHRGDQMIRLGTLISPWLSAAWPAQTGALVPTADIGRADTLAVVLGGPASAAELAGGLLANALGAGFINDIDLIRRAGDVRARRDGAGISYFALSADWSAPPDHSFVIEQGLHLLRDGGVPGAWLVAIQAAAVDGSASLARAITRMPELVAVVLSTKHWRRLAAWRVAVHKRGTAGPPGVAPNVLESVRAGQVATAEELQLLAELTAEAEAWLDRLEAAEAILERLLTDRAADPSRRTITSRLDAPFGVPWLSVEDGVWRQGHGPVRDSRPVVFQGHVDDFADGQVDVTVDLFGQLAEQAGYTKDDELAGLLERLPSGPVTRRFAELRGLTDQEPGRGTERE